MVYRRKVSALFEANMAMVPSTMASVRMRKRTKRSIIGRSRSQPLPLPPPHWWRRLNLHLQLIQKKRRRSSSQPSFQFDERRRQFLSTMKTRPVFLSPRLLLTVCSHQGGRPPHELRVVALPRVVALGSSVAPASPSPITSVHTMTCLESS